MEKLGKWVGFLPLYSCKACPSPTIEHPCPRPLLELRGRGQRLGLCAQALANRRLNQLVRRHQF